MFAVDLFPGQISSEGVNAMADQWVPSSEGESQTARTPSDTFSINQTGHGFGQVEFNFCFPLQIPNNVPPLHNARVPVAWAWFVVPEQASEQAYPAQSMFLNTD
jgi:hypothetical protein